MQHYREKRSNSIQCLLVEQTHNQAVKKQGIDHNEEGSSENDKNLQWAMDKSKTGTVQQ